MSNDKTDMDQVKKQLRDLAMEWRTKATTCQEKYRDQNPEATGILVAALEQCAHDLEELCLKL